MQSPSEQRKEFDPIEFLSLAQELYKGAKDTDLALCRTIVGRAYYSAFLIARKKAKLEGVTGDIHAKTAQYFKTKKSPIGSQLDGIKTLRIEADYKMSAVVTKRQAQNALKRAERIVKSLS